MGMPRVHGNIRRATLTLFVLVFTACGGGSDNPASPSPASADTSTAAEGLTATIDGQRVSMPLVYGTVFGVSTRRILWVMARESCTGGWGIDLRLERLPPGEPLTTGSYSTGKTFLVTQPQPTGLEPGLYREMSAVLSLEGPNLYWDAPDFTGAGSGQASLTTISSGIAQGTFSFNATSRTGINPRSVTNGTFRVQIVERRLC